MGLRGLTGLIGLIELEYPMSPMSPMSPISEELSCRNERRPETMKTLQVVTNLFVT